MRSRVSVTALTIGVVLLVTPAAAIPLPRLLGYPCHPAAPDCSQQPLFKPRMFQLGSHYWFTKAVWKSWNPWTASAVVTLHAQFAGTTDRPTANRTLVIFSRPKTLCGVSTFSQWVSGDGNSGAARKLPGSATCLFFVS